MFPFWVPIAAVSYFLSGLAAIIDKHLISKRIPSPASYSFYIGILGIGALVLAPWGFGWMPFKITLIALFAGAAFLVALFFFYEALKIDDASRVVPLVGGTSPFFILILTDLLLKQSLPKNELIAMTFFILGGLMLYAPKFLQKENHFSFKSLIYGLLSAFFIALTFFLSKWVYNNAEFLTGFIWMRMGSFLAAAFMLIFPRLRHDIFSTSRTTSKGSIYLFLINKGIGAAHFVLLNFALSLGPASVIDAMKGLEQIFVFAIAILATRFWPDFISESYHARDALGKVAGIICFVVGFTILL